MFWSGLASSGAKLRRAQQVALQALRQGGTAAVMASALAGSSTGWARTSDPDPSATVLLATLPVQAQTTYQLIHAGGPFPYPKDGVVFGNRERQLPAKPRGYYREYTVKTPGSRDRGARRIVCGGKPPTQPETCYYTDDHYASFKRIAASKAAP